MSHAPSVPDGVIHQRHQRALGRIRLVTCGLIALTVLVVGIVFLVAIPYVGRHEQRKVGRLQSDVVKIPHAAHHLYKVLPTTGDFDGDGVPDRLSEFRADRILGSKIESWISARVFCGRTGEILYAYPSSSRSFMMEWAGDFDGNGTMDIVISESPTIVINDSDKTVYGYVPPP